MASITINGITIDPQAQMPAMRALSLHSHDVHLIVRAANGKGHHRNMTSASKKFDRANNVERVVWRNVPAGNVEIIVRAWRITQFAQSYALVARLG